MLRGHGESDGGARQVVGDGMQRRLRHVNQGDLSSQRSVINRPARSPRVDSIAGSPEEPEKIHGRHTWENQTNPGPDMEAIVAGFNRLLRSWMGYFKHSHKWTFPRLNKWIRRRLRSILRKRSKRQSISRGFDHSRWPKKFFQDLGLVNLEDAHHALFQSS
jgi:hypothetical protein